MRHMRGLFTGFSLFAFCWLVAGEDSALDLCDLINRPQAFDGKRVTVRASYRYGFEWQEIYCLQCRHVAKVWLAIPPELPKAVQKSLNRLPKNQGTVNATLTGTFHGSRSAFGDGGYQYQLDLERLEQVNVVSKSGSVPDALRDRERAKLCQGRLQSPAREAHPRKEGPAARNLLLPGPDADGGQRVPQQPVGGGFGREL